MPCIGQLIFSVAQFDRSAPYAALGRLRVGPILAIVYSRGTPLEKRQDG
jgi:hypothetical protein